MPTYQATNTSAATTASVIYTNTVWQGWTNTITATTSATVTDTIWPLWTSGTATATTTTAGAWNNWLYQHHAGQPVTQQNWPPPMTEEQRARRQVLEAERHGIEAANAARWAAQRAEEQAKVREAEERALRLLVRVLNPVQREELARDGCFVVTAASGNRYRVDKGRSGNVKRIDATGQWIESLCIHQRDNVPVYDTMLMQKLLIETAEAEFRRVANITTRAGGFVRGQGHLDAQVLDLAQERERRARVAA